MACRRQFAFDGDFSVTSKKLLYQGNFVMGRGDSRRSAKMRQRKSLKKFKLRLKRKVEDAKKAKKKK